MIRYKDAPLTERHKKFFYYHNLLMKIMDAEQNEVDEEKLQELIRKRKLIAKKISIVLASKI